MVNRISILILLIAGVTTTSIYAQYNTGDTQLNASLIKIDDDAKLNFSVFKSDLSVTYNVSERKIESWSVEFGMKAGDIYLALEIGKIAKKPIDEVIKVYQANKTKGWGVIAKQLGIKPGSPEFHALKNSTDSKVKKGKRDKSNPNPKAGKGKPKGK